MKSAAWVQHELLRLGDKLAAWEPPRHVEKADEYRAQLNELLPYFRSLADDLVPEEYKQGLPRFSEDESLSPGDTISDDSYAALRGIIMLLGTSFPRDERLNVLHPRVWKVAASLYHSGYHGSAILEAYKAVNARVKDLTGAQGMDRDGKALMAFAFNANNPVLRLNDGTTRSDRDEQEGFSLIFIGAMQGIRNPKAHDPMTALDEDRTLEYLTLASLLMRRLDDAEERLPSSFPNGSQDT